MTARHLAVLIAAVMLLMVPAIAGSSEPSDGVTVSDLGGYYSGDSNTSGPTAAYSSVSRSGSVILQTNEVIYALVGGNISIDIDGTLTSYDKINTVGGLSSGFDSAEYIGKSTTTGTTFIRGSYGSGSSVMTSSILLLVIDDEIADYTTDLGNYSGTNSSSYSSAYSSVSGATFSASGGPVYVQMGATFSLTIPGSLGSSPDVLLNNISGLSVDTGNLLNPTITVSGTVGSYGDLVIVNANGDALVDFRVAGGDPPESTYMLSFNVGAGSGGPSNMTYGPTTDLSHTFTIPNTTPTRDYYIFEGWATSSGGSVVYDPGDQVTLSIDDPAETLYAVWEPRQYTYTLEFNANGGTGVPNTLSYGPTTATSHTFTIPNTTPTREGYTFVGYADSANGDPLYQPGGSFSQYVINNINNSARYDILYAIWDEMPTWTLQLQFNANGGTGAPSTLTYGPTTETSHNFTIPTQTPTNGTFEFLGWNTSPTAASTENLWQPGEVFTVSYDENPDTLYAIWSDGWTYSVAFNNNGGTGAPSTLTYGPTGETSHTFTIPDTVPTREGFIFTGWNTGSGGGGTTYQPGGSITLESEEGTATVHVLLYAQWAVTYTYTLAFSANGGTGAPSTLTYGPTTETSHNFTIPSDVPTLTDSTFMGWSTSSTGSVEYQPSGEITLTSSNYSVTLYAIWTTNLAFSITYNANGGTGAPDPQTYSSGTETEHTFTITSDEPTREGWVFMGWARDPDSGVAYYHGGDEFTVYSSNPQITMYAVWSTYVTFTLTFDANGGGDPPDVMTYGPTLDATHQFIIPDEVPTFQYREFLGWATSSSSMAEYEPGETITLDRDDIDVILYAVWGAVVTPGGVSITISGSTTASVGETRTLTAVVLPSDLSDRSVSWTVTAGEGIIDYQIAQTWRGSTLTYTATGAGTVTIQASAVADSDAVDIITITIGQASSDDSEVIGPQGIVGALGAALFGGSSSIAGVVLFAIILAVLFAIIREPLPVVLLGIPVLAIFTLLGILDMDMVILLIIVVTVGLALIARKMWRD